MRPRRVDPRRGVHDPLSTSTDPFGRYDGTDDALFYAVPRLVTHIDEGAIEALEAHYDAVLPGDGLILDLMSSWRSHLPDRIAPDRVWALGMNAVEMKENPQVGQFVVHDLNREPTLPYDDATFAAVVCAVSVQYLVRPVDVFRDVRRVLVDGGPFVVSFSNRCFPTKAVQAWLSTSDDMHVRLVSAYMTDAGFADVRTASLRTRDDPLFLVTGRGQS